MNAERPNPPTAAQPQPPDLAASEPTPSSVAVVVDKCESASEQHEPRSGEPHSWPGNASEHSVAADAAESTSTGRQFHESVPEHNEDRTVAVDPTTDKSGSPCF